MKHPKLKHPGICRLLSYVVVLGCAFLPVWLVFSLTKLDSLRVLVSFTALIGLLIYLLRNFLLLMSLDTVLALLCCYRTARTQYTLPPGRTPEAIRNSILRYGISCTPTPILPHPAALRYRFSRPATVYSRGIERVIAAYETDFLDKETYLSIFRSAKANSRALAGKQKAFFLDRQQEKAPLHRVTVLLILAHRLDSKMSAGLYDYLCKQCGSEDTDCIVPCVVDLSTRSCVFNCLRVPYTGLNYAVKNRGIRIVKYRVFGGTFCLRENRQHLALPQDMNPEDTLWDLWKELHCQFIGTDKKTRRCLASMTEKELRTENGLLYLKWDHRGICQRVVLNPENKHVKVEKATLWSYPKPQPVSKSAIRAMEAHITSYYAKLGYSAEYIPKEKL